MASTTTNNNSTPKKKETPSSLEEQSIAQGTARIKFQTLFQESLDPPSEDEWQPLATCLALGEALGAAPISEEEGGLVFGNGAQLCEDGSSIVVSKSGRRANRDYNEEQFVRVTNFDCDQWKATYGGNQSNNKPSSDTPLLSNALVVAPRRFDWWSHPRLALHGHSCATPQEADAKGFPCSTRETLFSTPADLRALMDLFQRCPYPQYSVFVRKNHGFFLLAQTQQEACRIFRQQLVPPKQNEEKLSLSAASGVFPQTSRVLSLGANPTRSLSNLSTTIGAAQATINQAKARP